MDTAALSLVTSYLKIQGLPETLETLKKELGSDNVLASPGVAARPEHYVESHARLEEWIACSLERYKAEITGPRQELVRPRLRLCLTWLTSSCTSGEAAMP